MFIIILKVIVWAVIFLYTILTIVTIKLAIYENNHNNRLMSVYAECLKRGKLDKGARIPDDTYFCMAVMCVIFDIFAILFGIIILI